MSMKPIRDLNVKTVKQLFSSPKRWCKDLLISDDGMSCCLMGAVDRVYRPDERADVVDKLVSALNKRRKKQKKGPIGPSALDKHAAIFSWNDSSRVKFEDVKELVNDAGI